MARQTTIRQQHTPFVTLLTGRPGRTLALGGHMCTMRTSRGALRKPPTTRRLGTLGRFPWRLSGAEH